MANQRLTDRLPLAAGAGGGIAAYVFGYLLTYLATTFG